MAKPRKAGCWRVEIAPGKWAWMITLWDADLFDKRLYFVAAETVPCRRLDLSEDYVKNLKPGLRYVEVKAPKGERNESS